MCIRDRDLVEVLDAMNDTSMRVSFELFKDQPIDLSPGKDTLILIGPKRLMVDCPSEPPLTKRRSAAANLKSSALKRTPLCRKSSIVLLGSWTSVIQFMKASVDRTPMASIQALYKYSCHEERFPTVGCFSILTSE